MENENEEVIDSINDTEKTENQEDVIEEEIDVEALRKENETLKAQKEHWRKKAERHEEPVKELDSKSDGLSSKDIFALTKANIHEDDIEEVIEFAKFKKIPVSEALKSSTVKSLLAEKDEKRRSDEVSNTRNATRGSSQVSVEKLMSDANSGKLPEKDEDIQRLLKSKMKIK